MTPNLDDSSNRHHDLDDVPEPENLSPIILGRHKAFCRACRQIYDYHVDMYPWCPGCCRTPNGR